ncbi:hypothetical protein AB0C28_42715 [Nonomuraea sp. NPDC048892]|uniref:hypothetical protein n=1 Tax=Nonomuraea sp. NPDC048892 TaxID=3154624 RepID=UPI0033C82A12
MNSEAQFLELVQRIETLETNTRADAETTAIGFHLVLTELAELRAEIADQRTETRQDSAALGDELGGLRWHMHDHFTALHRENLHWLITVQQLINLARQEPTHN